MAGRDAGRGLVCEQQASSGPGGPKGGWQLQRSAAPRVDSHVVPRDFGASVIKGRLQQPRIALNFVTVAFAGTESFTARTELDRRGPVFLVFLVFVLVAFLFLLFVLLVVVLVFLIFAVVVVVVLLLLFLVLVVVVVVVLLLLLLLSRGDLRRIMSCACLLAGIRLSTVQAVARNMAISRCQSLIIMTDI